MHKFYLYRTSLVAASHRSGRTPEEKRKSAEKASALHEQITGSPLKIAEGTNHISVRLLTFPIPYLSFFFPPFVLNQGGKFLPDKE